MEGDNKEVLCSKVRINMQLYLDVYGAGSLRADAVETRISLESCDALSWNLGDLWLEFYDGGCNPKSVLFAKPARLGTTRCCGSITVITVFATALSKCSEHE